MSDLGWVEIHQDITSQKRAEAELARAEPRRERARDMTERAARVELA